MPVMVTSLRPIFVPFCTKPDGEVPSRYRHSPKVYLLAIRLKSSVGSNDDFARSDNDSSTVLSRVLR